MKKIIYTLILAILSLTLISCTRTTETVPEGRNEVKMWLIQNESFDVAWWKEQVDTYNNSQDVNYVKISWVDSGAWDTKINSAREGGTAPDIVTYPISGVAQQAQYGTLEPLNNYISNLDTLLLDFDDKVKANITSSEGLVYGIPRLLEPSMLMYYRKDILSAAGWDEAPKTLDELASCASDVTTYLQAHKELKLSKTMQVASNNEDYGWVSWAVQYQLSGHESSLNEDWTRANLEGYEKVCEYWADLHDMAGCAPQALTSGGYKDDYAAILEGKVAIQQCGSWIWGTLYSLDDYSSMIDKIGVAPWPTTTGTFENEILCSLGGWSLAIERGGTNKEGAADFIRWCLLDAESASRLYNYFEAAHFCKVSPRKSVNDLLSSETAGTNAMRDLLVNVLLDNSMMEPTYPWEISQYIGNQYVAYVSDGKKASVAMKDAENEINGYILANEVSKKKFN